MNCDSRCAACELPKFTLQPIVENSIVHGMRSRSEGGRIRIVTESTPNGCRIQITDNGGGFSRSKMKQNTAEGHRSIGLQNIAGRIALSGGSFRIVSCPGLGTTARIILPMKGRAYMLKVLIAEDEPLSLAESERTDARFAWRGCTHRGSCERTGGG